MCECTRLRTCAAPATASACHPVRFPAATQHCAPLLSTQATSEARQAGQFAIRARTSPSFRHPATHLRAATPECSVAASHRAAIVPAAVTGTGMHAQLLRRPAEGEEPGASEPCYKADTSTRHPALYRSRATLSSCPVPCRHITQYARESPPPSQDKSVLRNLEKELHEYCDTLDTQSQAECSQVQAW